MPFTLVEENERRREFRVRFRRWQKMVDWSLSFPDVVSVVGQNTRVCGSVRVVATPRTSGSLSGITLGVSRLVRLKRRSPMPSVDGG